MNKIVIISKIAFKDYLHLMFILTYKKPVMWGLTLLGLFMLVFSVLHLSGVYRASESSPYLALAFGLLTVVLPFGIYRQSNKAYYSNKMLQEQIKYSFDNQKIEIIGESFESSLSWEKCLKLQNLKNWILIYYSNNLANLLPKACFTSDQLVAFLDIAKSIPNMKIEK